MGYKSFGGVFSFYRTAIKLYILKCVPEKIIDQEEKKITEILAMEKIQHAAFPVLIASGSIETNLGAAQYFVSEYFSGTVLAGELAEKKKFSVEEAIQIYRDILVGLQHLHSLGYCHNDITPANIMRSNKVNKLTEIIDMGHASHPCYGTLPFDTSDLDVRYCSNSCFAGIFSPRSNLFSATAILFTLLTGSAPWETPIPDYIPFAQKMQRMKKYRSNNLPDFDNLQIEDYLIFIISKGLELIFANKYNPAEEILKDLDSKSISESEYSIPEPEQQHQSTHRREQDPAELSVDIEKSGNGFADIAGMQNLKDTLTKKVIFVLQNEALAKEYKLTPPNGLLLYGPPGCGKTFFAEKFAEETGFNFILIKSSDLSSIYVHGSQQMIGELFNRAESNAPTVICFDEFDALVSNHSKISNASESREVNEFLSQLNNCSRRGIFVIATSNRPDMIDPAVLRTGRIDKHIYVPIPDKEARMEMFRIHLKGRPYEENEIDFEKLAKQTDGYIASDIAYIVNDAAMVAAFTRSKITQEIIEKSIQSTSPSIQPELATLYEELHMKMEGKTRQELTRHPIGFRLND